MPLERLIRILLIEDERDDAELVRRQLRALQPQQRFDLCWVQDLDRGLAELLTGRRPDLVLLDLTLPDSLGLSTLVRLRERDPEVPVVVFSAAGDMEQALLALEAGAQDYLVKDELVAPAPLLRSIRYAMERSRIAREKAASLGVLSAGVAIGFNRLMGSILDRAEQAVRDLGQPQPLDAVRRQLNEIRRDALRGGQMAGQLRDYAVGAPMLARSIDLSSFVRDTSELIGSLAPARVEVRYELSEEPPTANAGRLQLHQMLLALVQNAAEAMGDGPGRLSLSTGVYQVGPQVLRSSRGNPQARPGRYATLSVEDTGSGIDPATRDRIFDPFFTTKSAGRGLGLAAAVGIARQCRAVIRVESEPGQGSRFDVMFPTSTSEEKRAEALH